MTSLFTRKIGRIVLAGALALGLGSLALADDATGKVGGSSKPAAVAGGKSTSSTSTHHHKRRHHKSIGTSSKGAKSTASSKSRPAGG